MDVELLETYRIRRNVRIDRICLHLRINQSLDLPDTAELVNRFRHHPYYRSEDDDDAGQDHPIHSARFPKASKHRNEKDDQLICQFR
jgi:hypothetical protein